jgi:hypothetical protein
MWSRAGQMGSRRGCRTKRLATQRVWERGRNKSRRVPAAEAGRQVPIGTQESSPPIHRWGTRDPKCQPSPDRDERPSPADSTAGGARHFFRPCLRHGRRGRRNAGSNAPGSSGARPGTKPSCAWKRSVATVAGPGSSRTPPSTLQETEMRPKAPRRKFCIARESARFMLRGVV